MRLDMQQGPHHHLVIVWLYDGPLHCVLVGVHDLPVWIDVMTCTSKVTSGASLSLSVDMYHLRQIKHATTCDACGRN